MIELKLTTKQASLLTGLSEFELQDKLESAEDPGAVIFEAARERSKTVGAQKVAEGYSKLGKRANSLLRPLAEKYGFDLADTIEESFEALQNALTTTGTPDGNLTKEELQKHPAVVALLNERAQALSAKFEEQRKALESQVSEVKKAATRTAAVKSIATILQSENAVLGQATPERAAEIALSMIGLDALTIDSAGNIVVTKDGQAATDEFGNALSLTDVVKSSWALGFNQADPTKQGAGAPLPGKTPAPQGARFASVAEAQQALQNPKITPAERSEIFKEVIKLQQA